MSTATISYPEEIRLALNRYSGTLGVLIQAKQQHYVCLRHLTPCDRDRNGNWR